MNDTRPNAEPHQFADASFDVRCDEDAEGLHWQLHAPERLLAPSSLSWASKNTSARWPGLRQQQVTERTPPLQPGWRLCEHPPLGLLQLREHRPRLSALCFVCAVFCLGSPARADTGDDPRQPDAYQQLIASSRYSCSRTCSWAAASAGLRLGPSEWHLELNNCPTATSSATSCTLQTPERL